METSCLLNTGLSFHVLDQNRFAKEVLPLYFKHSNIASFIRQLNMYGFRKILNLEHGSLKSERDDMEFAHQFFQRDREDLLEFIKRKVSHTKGGGGEDVKIRPDAFHTVLNEVHDVQDRQEQFTSSLNALKQENEALWREVASLRQKHLKQQQIVNKLVQFLVSLVGNKRAVPGMKRKMPLMLNDASQLQEAKVPKTSHHLYQTESDSDFGATTKSGHVTIQEVTDQVSGNDFLDPVGEIPPSIILEQDLPSSSEPQVTVMDSTAQSPLGLSSVAMAEDATPVSETVASPQSNVSTVTTVDLPLSTVLQQPLIGSLVPSKEDMVEQVDNVQTDIDSLKDLLLSYHVDTNTLSGLFTPEAPLPMTPDALLKMMSDDVGVVPEAPLPDPISQHIAVQSNPGSNIVGNELIQYNPVHDDIAALLDLTDAGILGESPATPSAPTNPDVDTVLHTPKIEVNSKLAKRRLTKNSLSEEVD